MKAIIHDNSNNDNNNDNNNHNKQQLCSNDTKEKAELKLTSTPQRKVLTHQK